MHRVKIRVATTPLCAALAIALSTAAAHAQPSQLNSAVRTHQAVTAPLTAPAISARIPDGQQLKVLQPDFTILSAGEMSKNVYYAKIKNIGPLASATSNLYCAANISTPGGGGRADERVAVVAPLKAGEVKNLGCDFNSGAGGLKKGEVIFDVHFIINNGKQAKESNSNNNDRRCKPGEKFDY